MTRHSAGGDGGAERPDGSVLSLSVPKMDCPSCAGKVEASLERVEGVLGTDLRPIEGTAIVTYDPARIGEGDVAAAIEGAGYAVRGRASEDTAGAGAGSGSETGETAEGRGEIAPPAEVWTSERAIRTWIGGLLVLVGLTFEFVLGWNPTVVSTPLGALSASDAAFVLAAAASGVAVVRSGYYSARNRSLDIDLLMGAAIVAAMAVGLFVEAATLAVLFSVAELLERYAMDRTRDSLRELIALAPEEATVVRGGEEATVPVGDVEIGDTVAVRPGEKIPVDGVVRDGESAVDQSAITGESVPVDKAVGDEVYAGTINEAGYLELEATSVEGDSTLSRIVDLVRDARSKRTDREQFVDRFAGYYTPVVVALAVATAVVPPLVIDTTVTVSVAGYSHAFVGGWRTWFVRGLTLLVIACPCAFVISTPVSVASGVTAAARNGVLIKGGRHLEAMGEVDAVAFDKTGTLTKGELAVTDVVPAGGASETEVLRYAGALERRSEHPIAEAVLDRARGRGVETPEVSAFETVSGRGVRASVDGTVYYAGNPAFFAETDGPGGEALTDGGVGRTAERDAERAVERDAIDVTVRRLQREGKTVVLVWTDERVLGAIGIADEIRPEAKRAIAELRELGVGPIVMLTGDNEGTARAVAEELGVDAHRAGLLPDEKVEAVAELRAEHGDVAMVGDGINDAPALASATVGVAMGAAGSDAAIETADIALMGDGLGKVPYLYALARDANSVIRQSIWASLGVKTVLAVGVPFGYVSVAVAVLVGDMGMSLGVTANAMRLSRISPERFLDPEGEEGSESENETKSGDDAS
ncbi:heavy metal translocating P-type ATPase [Natronomonas sp.]|uniref:heavy metal translocating P-type ATPase n=1 Tax=Natronomonas sp. TaxID=2184060 RepID=UPI002614139C|nr:cation-translocating P-type ATPase [Natronomonas sp.]